MNANVFRFLAPGILTSAALVLAGSAGAQTSTLPAPSDAAVKQNVDMKADCQTMIAKKQEMEDKMKAMDATLDKLVADMNAAAGSKAIGAMEKPMAALLNELISQRKASRAMATEKETAMMAHMMRHMNMKGAMECPMMKAASIPEPKVGEQQPKM